MRTLLLSAFLAAPFALFAFLAWSRRARFRALAAALGGRYEARGWTAPGAIRGERFEIEAVQVGKTYRTRVQLSLENSPGCYWLRSAFFAATPDWTCVKVPGTRNERVFLWEVAIRGAVEPTREQRDRLLQWLGRSALTEGTRAALGAARIDLVQIDAESVSVSFRGIVAHRTRLEATLAALRRLAPDAPARLRSA